MKLEKTLNGLDHFKDYFIENINLDSTNGFTFFGVYSGQEMQDAINILGTPTFLHDEIDSQQTAEYIIPIMHPRLGFFQLRSLNILLWGFNRKPIKIVQFMLNCDRYFEENREPFIIFVKEFINLLVEKFGKPTKKTLRRGNESVIFNSGKDKFYLYMNNGRLCIQLTKPTAK